MNFHSPYFFSPGAAANIMLLLAAFPLAAEPLATVAVQAREVDLTYSAEAVVEAVKQSTVSAEISGRVTQILFDVGDAVQKGQVLLRIDPNEVGQVLVESEAQFAATQANAVQARAQYERSHQLFSKGFISQAALDKAAAEFKAAEAQATARRAGVSIAATRNRQATVVAPYSGVVAARHIELGEMATPGKALMTGFDPQTLRVTASIPQYKLTQVRDGLRQTQAASVEFSGQNKRIAVPAKAISIQPAADAQTHTTRVRLDLPATLTEVYPGQFARVHFAVGRGQKLLVPQSAVVRRSEVTAVYVVTAPGEVQLRQVRLGEAVSEGEIEVLAGLSGGEQIALDPVKAGMRIKARSED